MYTHTQEHTHRSTHARACTHTRKFNEACARKRKQRHIVTSLLSRTGAETEINSFNINYRVKITPLNGKDLTWIETTWLFFFFYKSTEFIKKEMSRRLSLVSGGGAIGPDFAFTTFLRNSSPPTFTFLMSSGLTLYESNFTVTVCVSVDYLPPYFIWRCVPSPASFFKLIHQEKKYYPKIKLKAWTPTVPTEITDTGDSFHIGSLNKHLLTEDFKSHSQYTFLRMSRYHGNDKVSEWAR